MDALTSPLRGTLWDKTRQWVAAHPNWTLALVVFAALGPFLAKPFNMDDPLFIWTARQIHAHPWNPYGFNANWYGSPWPMWNVTENPPLASYYLALAAGVLGWSEMALHGAFLLPALAVILGTYRLARRFCDQPLLAALATLFTPVFLVSSNTVMCDVLMLAFWVWAVVFWIEGMERDAIWPLAGAGLLMALAALTKYYGACLIPLLAAYSMMSRRQVGRWAVCLLIPALALCAWEWASHELYQHDLFWKAVDYAGRKSGFFAGERALATLTALTFSGGCLAAVLFMAPWLWRARVLLALFGGVVALAVAVFCEGTIFRTFYWIKGGLCASMAAQMVFWAAGGALVLALTVADVRSRRDARAWLLALWVIGTFAFTAIFNWTINGRSILPMAPAVGILLARRWQQRIAANENKPVFDRSQILIPLAASAFFALLVARSDYLFAAALRQSALQTHELYGHLDHKLWFEGHWGFQYYMAELGEQALDMDKSDHHPGDYLALPLNNSNVHFPDFPGRRVFNYGPGFLTVMNMFIGAGFYSSTHGPLPFVFGPVPPDSVMVYH
jgi:4-amino-4-deoxy-L-arabinose transferase-like glycosyltransferase